MRNIIEKTTRVAALALALAFGLATTGWGAASIEETGATVPTTATLAFKGAKLSQVTADTLSAAFCGSSAGAATGAAVTFNNFDRSSEATGTITCQAQVADDGYIKSVLLSFTESGSDINVQKTGAKYISGTAVGPSTATGNDGNYDIARLKLALAKPAPLAVFDGASGGFKKSSVNGVTFAANGNTVADDGSYVKISTSVGALFKLDAGYEFVVGEFTVTNLNESAAADRALVLWSPSEDGTSVSSPGVMLKGGTVETRGVWLNKLWGDDKTELNSTLKTGVSTLTQRTFVLTTEDSKIGGVTDNTTGTHLFELTGANPGTAVYGGTGSMGLRGDQAYRTLVIGGPATGSLSAMTDLVITKVVIYASNGARQFTSTNPTTIANVENPAAFYVGNEETINASTINAGVEAFASAYVYTEAGATLNLDAALMGRATFAGSISGVPTATRGLTLGSVNDKVTLTNEAYDPVLKGVGTVVYPDNTIPSASSIWLKSSEWAGTLSLSGIQGSSSGQPGWYAPFHNYGSANSTIKVSGFTGFFAAGNFESPAALEIAAGSTFTLNNGNGGNSMTFAKLKGSGDIVICGNNGPAIQYVMRDASEFAGNITVSQSGSSTFKKSIVLGGGSSYNYNTGKYQKQICVLGNVTIAAGKTWVADSGIVVDGTLTLAASDSSMPVVASGTGKIVCINKVPNNSGLTASTWTGTLEINADTTSGTISGSTQFMNAASKLNLAEGYLSLTGVLELPGEVSVASGAILYLGKTDATTASVKVGTLGGAISTQFATSLETLTLDLGTARTFDWTKINQGNNQNLTVNISLTEGAGENGTTVFIPANFNANNTYNYTIKHIDGTAISATPVINGETGAVTFTYIPQVDGDACWHAYEFNNNWTDSVSNGAHDCRTWNPSEPNFAADADKDGNYFVYTAIRPGPTDSKTAYSYPAEWSAAIRCTVPQTANSIIVCFGKVTNSAGLNQYIALVSGDTAGKVRLVYGAGGGKAEDIAEMTVANPTTSQHVYVFTKTATTVTVYCDGDLITSKAVSASPYNAFQFGTQYGGMQSGSGLSAVTDKTTGGMVDYTRLYDFVIGQNMIQKLADDDPYDSATPTYSREVSGSPWWYTGDGTWLKSDDSTLVGVPDVAGIVDLTATADATMTVNLPAAPVYEKLTFQGAGAVTLVKNGSSPKIATAKLVVKTNVTAPYDIADFSGARVSVDTGKVLTFDFSTYPLESVTGVTTQQVTGVTTRTDDRYAVVASTKSAWNSKLSLIYDPVEYVYSVVIDPAATVTKNNSTVAYPTVAAALTAFSTDAGTIRLLVDYDQDITLSAGQTLDVGSTTYSGSVSAASGCVLGCVSGVYTSYANTTGEEWTGAVDSSWNNAGNWDKGFVPLETTPVTFSSHDGGWMVGLVGNDYSAENVKHKCASVTLNGDVTFQRGSDHWAYVLTGGDIDGTGTMRLEQVGIKTAASGSVTIGCPVVGHASANDNFFSGSGATYTFTGTVNVSAGEFKSDYAHLVFSDVVTIQNGGYVKANGSGATATFNGGISVPENAAASLTVASGTHTIASTVTLADGATLTVPTSSTTVSGATFATSVADSVVKATTSDGSTVYSVVDNSAATWTGGATGNWNDPTKWSTGVVPGSNTAVTFPAGTYTVGLSYNNGDIADECASLTLNGDVTLNRAVANTWAQVCVYGNVSGTGTLTLSDVGIKNVSGSVITVANDIVVASSSGKDSFFSLGTITINGNVTVQSGAFKSENAHLSINGLVTLNDGADVRAQNGTASVTFNGGIAVPANASAVLTAQPANTPGTNIVACAVTLGAGATFTYPTAETTVSSGASFTTSATDCYVKSAVSGSTTVYSVVAKPSVGNVAFAYGENYGTATVTATVSDTTATYKLTVGGTDYTGTVSGTTVTFTGVATGHATAYDSMGYAITATDSGSATVPLVGDTTGSALIADSTAWVNENADTTGTAAAGGSWTTAVTYENNVATVSDNTFTAVNCSTGDLVTVTVENVVYAELSDMDVSGLAADSQGAFCLGTNMVNDAVVTNFMILAKENDAFVWKPATWSGTPALNTSYNVEFTFDYAHGKYSVKINGTALTVNSATAFDLCTAKTEVKSIDFKGSGTLSSIQGTGYSGYMVKDGAGNWYATIADAIQNYSAANGPYVVLHSYSAASVPSGWKVETIDGVMVLKRDIKGVMILTY